MPRKGLRNRRGRSSKRGGRLGAKNTSSPQSNDSGLGSNASVQSNMLESQTRWPKLRFVRFPGVGFPDKLRLTLKYNETVAFSGAISPAAQVWNANSIFQVNATSGTGTPSFYNALGTIYKRYEVFGISAIVEVSSSMTSGSGFQWALQCSDQNSAGKSTLQMRESRFVIGGSVGIIGGGYTVSRKKFPYLTMAEVNGQDEVEDDPSLYAGIGASPTDITLMTYRCTSNDGTNNASGVVRVTFFMDVGFKEVIDVAA